ncbi:hypothetical protein [Blackfly microvirus SF02]|uniref:Uncharacterized protein n=1 Tax=Blackfly microvirus SF02 TaxID=2576452 RepID=A0A4P8PSJ0_9VIRU|nr:hypothetical protein [Blackfly microvirus SF02]
MDKAKVSVVPHPVTGECVDESDLFQAMESAGWTDDPLDGKAILLPDGREVLNPLPIAPPIGFRAEPSIIDLINRQIAAHQLLLADSLEVDTEEESNDFDLPDEPPDPRSIYEVMVDEYPDLDNAIARESSPALPEQAPAETAVPPVQPEPVPVEPVPAPPIPTSQPLSVGEPAKRGRLRPGGAGGR